MNRKQRDRIIVKVLAESTQLISALRGHSLPIIKHSSLLSNIQAILRGSQELRDTCMIDWIPLQEGVVTAKILDGLTKAVGEVKGIFPRLGEGQAQSSPLVTTVVNEVAAILPQITLNLKEHETSMTVAADERATMPSLLRRLTKKCNQHPHLTHNIQIW